jgi:hypothetical protein
MSLSPTITLQPISVMTDGGSRIGWLVMADDHLVAVFTVVSAEEAGNGMDDGGWFLEAGFGPCSTIMTTPPPIFTDFDAAQVWVSQQITRERTGRL